MTTETALLHQPQPICGNDLLLPDASCWLAASTSDYNLVSLETDLDDEIPSYPSQSPIWGGLDDGYDAYQWPGNRFVNIQDQYTITERNELTNFNNMYQAKVIDTFEGSHPYKMWFFGWAVEVSNPGYPGSDAVFHARSKDRVNWEVYSGRSCWGNKDKWDATMNPNTWVPVLTAGDLNYDNWHSGDPSVVWHEGTYYMAYSSTGKNEDGYIYAVNGATSQNGIDWTPTQHPLLVYGPEIGGGSADDEVTLWGSFHRPSLLLDEGVWRLWFDYWTGILGGVSMGYAEKSFENFDDGRFDILFGGDNPLLLQWPNPSVIKAGNKYYSVSDPPGHNGGVGWPSRQVAEAESDDGITWTITGFVPSDSDTPANQVPEVTLVDDPFSGRTELVVYYACQIGGADAGSDDYDFHYNRIRSMKRSLAPDVALPLAPTNLAAAVVPHSGHAIDLAWSYNQHPSTEDEEEVREFCLYRSSSSDGSDWARIACLPNTGSRQFTYQDHDLRATTTYRYRVQARSGTLGSPYSNTVAARTTSAWESFSAACSMLYKTFFAL